MKGGPSALGWGLGGCCGGGALGAEEEVAQGLGLDPCDADEDPGVMQIVIRDEVSVGVGGDHVIALVNVHADDKGFAVLMEAGEERAADFETGSAIGADLLDAVEGEGDLADGGKGDGHTQVTREAKRKDLCQVPACTMISILGRF